MPAETKHDDFKSELIEVINDKQQVTYNELAEFASSRDVDEDELKLSLKELESMNAIASRNSGGILTYYVLQETTPLRRIMIVEDDKNINKLMALSIGKGFDITQIYDGAEALERIKMEKPDLVVLDLMLPNVDGLTICQTIKKDPNLSDTIVIIVSAMDATSNRFKGIKYGADYYIKKPFDPDTLRSLVTIFLKKKGKRFDPLIDLPNEDKISNAVEKAVKSDLEYEIGKLRVDGLVDFANKFGTNSGMTILRLVSQLLQDNVAEANSGAFVGFLNSDDFVIAGDKDAVERVVKGIKEEFEAVLPFIYQSEGYKPIELGIEDIYGAESPKLSLIYTPIKRDSLIEKRAEIIKSKPVKDIGSYTYDELRRMLGSDNLDITITRDPSGVKLSIGKGPHKKESENNQDEA
ncbi:MAG: response regulator [Candidatus Micrarchaeaceae archaeon]